MKFKLLLLLLLLSVHLLHAEINDYHIGIKYFGIDAALESGNVMQKSKTTNQFIEILDGKINTFFSFKNPEMAHLTLSLTFDRKIPIDEIKVLIGNGRNEIEFRKNYRIKEGIIGLCNYDKYGGRIDNFVSTPNARITFNDINRITNCIVETNEFKNFIGFQDFDFTYTSWFTNGVTTDEFCISEIQFWYKGNKYEFTNLLEVQSKWKYEHKLSQNHWIGDAIKYKDYKKYLRKKKIIIISLSSLVGLMILTVTSLRIKKLKQNTS